MKTAMEQEQTQKKSIFDTHFLIVWGVCAAIVGAVCIFYGWKTWALSQENRRFEVSIENTQKRIQALAPGASEELLKKRTEIQTRAKKFRTNWSTVMEQIVALETPAARFSRINLSGEKISASCQTTSWNGLANFIDTLEKNSRVRNVRISETSVLSPEIAGANQSAEVTFDFSLVLNENK